jgi:hypothetical protein
MEQTTILCARDKADNKACPPEIQKRSRSPLYNHRDRDRRYVEQLLCRQRKDKVKDEVC